MNHKHLPPDYVQGCPKVDCVYRIWDGICTYFLVENTTRTFLHKDENVDINNPCREYKPGKATKYVMQINNRR